MASENVPACIHEVFVFCFVKTCHILLYQTCTFQIFLTCFPHQCFCYSAVTQLINHSRKLWFCCPAVFADLPVDHNFTKSGVYHKISAKNTIFGRSSTASHVQQMKNVFADTGWHKKRVVYTVTAVDCGFWRNFISALDLQPSLITAVENVQCCLLIIDLISFKSCLISQLAVAKIPSNVWRVCSWAVCGVCVISAVGAQQRLKDVPVSGC